MDRVTELERQVEALQTKIASLVAGMQFQLAYAEAERLALRSLLTDEQLQAFYRERQKKMDKYEAQKELHDKLRGLDW